jgi:hypothetical protein
LKSLRDFEFWILDFELKRGKVDSVDEEIVDDVDRVDGR